MEGVDTGKKMEMHLDVKKKTRRAVYQAKCNPDRKRFGNIMWRYDRKCDVFKTEKQMVKFYRNVIG